MLNHLLEVGRYSKITCDTEQGTTVLTTTIHGEDRVYYFLKHDNGRFTVESTIGHTGYSIVDCTCESLDEFKTFLDVTYHTR